MCANYVRRERLNAPVVHKNIFSGTGLFISHATLAIKVKPSIEMIEVTSISQNMPVKIYLYGYRLKNHP